MTVIATMMTIAPTVLSKCRALIKKQIVQSILAMCHCSLVQLCQLDHDDRDVVCGPQGNGMLDLQQFNLLVSAHVGKHTSLCNPGSRV